MFGDRETALPIGGWERAMLNAHAADDGFCVNWTVALDAAPDPAAVAAALDAVRPAFPRYFALARRGADGWFLTGGLPAAAVIRTHGGQEGGLAGFAGRLARTRLDPERDGLFRCHLVDGPDPLLAFQATHVVGDGHTNHAFRTAFAAALAQVAEGRRPEPLPPAPDHPSAGPDDVAALLAPDPRAFAVELRGMRQPVVPFLPAGAGDAPVRVFRTVVPLDRFAPVMRRAAGLGVTPLALTLAALCGAVGAEMAPLDPTRGEFLLPQVPRDFRAALKRPADTGNLVYAQGVPLLPADPADTDELSRVVQDRMRRGQANRLMYRHFLHELKMGERPPPPVGRVEPLPVFGVTEIPNRGGVERLGGARVLDTVFQTPVLTRRFAGGTVHLGCAVRCPADGGTAVRRLFDGLLERLFGDIPPWDLL